MLYKRLVAITLAASQLYSNHLLANDHSTRSLQLEEVMVTAQRKEESLQEAPISITAFDNEALEVFGIEGLGDLGTMVPNMNIRPFPLGSATLRIKIRGIGSTDVQVTQDPSIGVYLNDVYIARSTGLAMDTADLRSIEVLKGPQGTLFGRNAVGGAIKMETVPPSLDGVEFKQKFGVGNRDYFQSRTVINTPLTKSIAAKAVYVNSREDGYVSNDGPGQDFYDEKSEGGRFDIRWEATDDLTIDYAYDFSRLEQANPTYQAVNLPYNSAFSTYRGGYTDPDTGNLSGPSYMRAYVPYSEKRLSTLNTVAPLKPTDTAIDGHTLNIQWDLDWATFKSISAYRMLDEQRYTDLGSGSPVIRIDPNGVRAPTEQDQYSQEFQLQGEMFDNRVNYVTGLYYFKEKAEENKNRPERLVAVNFFGTGHVLNPDAIVPYMNTFGNGSAEVENSAWAVYGQADFVPDILNDRLTLTLGLRYTEDKREARVTTETITYQSGFDSLGIPGFPGLLGTQDEIVDRAPAVDGHARDDFESTSYLVVASYDWSDDVTTYLKVATSHKSGGYNIREGAPYVLKGADAKGITEEAKKNIAEANAAVTATFEEGFEPEEVISYEIGLKSEWWDNRVRLNAAVFHNEYDDIQINMSIPETNPPSDTNVFNAGVARIRGAEVDLTALLVEGLKLTVGYGYTDAEYTKVVDPRTGQNTEDSLIFDGAPEHSYTLSLDYEFEPFAFGVLSANINYVWQDEITTTANNSYSSYLEGDTTVFITPEQVALWNEPNLPPSEIKKKAELSKIDDYGLLNARITLSQIPAFSDGEFTVALWGKNLEDKDYIVDTIVDFVHTDRAVLFGEPRSYGIDLTYQY